MKNVLILLVLFTPTLLLSQAYLLEMNDGKTLDVEVIKKTKSYLLAKRLDTNREIKLKTDTYKSLTLKESIFSLNEERDIEISKIIQAEGKSKAELFKIARSWLIGLNNGESLLVDDKEEGLLTGSQTIQIKAETLLGTQIYYNTKYLIRVLCKDGRFKVIATNFYTNYISQKTADMTKGLVGRNTVDREIKYDTKLEVFVSNEMLSKKRKRVERSRYDLARQIDELFNSIEKVSKINKLDDW